MLSNPHVLGIAVGAESLSGGNERLSRPFADELREATQEVKDAELPMGNTSENVARDFGISRQMQVCCLDGFYSAPASELTTAGRVRR